MVTKGIDKSNTNDLTSIVKTYIEIPSEYLFCSKPIHNQDETISLSDQTSRHVKSRYISETLNDVYSEQNEVQNYTIKNGEHVSKKNVKQNMWKENQNLLMKILNLTIIQLNEKKRIKKEKYDSKG